MRLSPTPRIAGIHSSSGARSWLNWTICKACARLKALLTFSTLNPKAHRDAPCTLSYPRAKLSGSLLITKLTPFWRQRVTSLVRCFPAGTKPSWVNSVSSCFASVSFGELREFDSSDVRARGQVDGEGGGQSAGDLVRKKGQRAMPGESHIRRGGRSKPVIEDLQRQDACIAPA